MMAAQVLLVVIVSGYLLKKIYKGYIERKNRRRNNF